MKEKNKIKMTKFKTNLKDWKKNMKTSQKKNHAFQWIYHYSKEKKSDQENILKKFKIRAQKGKNRAYKKILQRKIP